MPASAPSADAQWRVSPSDSAAVDELAKATGLTRAIAKLLLCRGFDTAAKVQAFLKPSLSDLHDPYLMLGMDTAVSRLRQALQGREPILIYGDYDVDGTIATVLLKVAAERAASTIGTSADVRFHIPHRLREGYGMQASRLESAVAEGVRLVVSVDTGIRAFAAAEEARKLGIDLIVTDHHLPDITSGIPNAIAVLNPNQPGCSYPYKDLCGAGVAFKLAQALLESSVRSSDEFERLRKKTLPSFLKLVSIATIADAVPLTGENRIIAYFGLQELRKPSQHGLKALMELAAIDVSRPLSAADVGFRIAPRINAAGRMDIASDVVDMFLAQEPEPARRLAEKLHSLNEDRRATEAEALLNIEAQISAMANSPTGLPLCVVLDDPQWHRGVIGILASRVVDRTGRPALVISHEDGQAYGSGRSVPGFHLLDAITLAHGIAEPQLFNRFGGHAHAVGFSLDSARVDDLRLRVADAMMRQNLVDDSTRWLDCDLPVAFGELTPDFLNALEEMGPFGQGNPEPLLLSRGVRLLGPLRTIKGKHLRICLEDPQSRRRFDALLWSRRVLWVERAEAECWVPGDLFDVAFRMHRNWHPDFGGWELEVVDIRRSSDAQPQ